MTDTVVIISTNDLPKLYNTYMKEILSYIQNTVPDKEDAKEIVQDVFYKLCEEVQKKELSASYIRAYLYTIAHNLCVDIFRKQKINTVEIQNEVMYKSSERTMEQRLTNGMLIEAIEEFIKSELSDREREVFNLKFMSGLTLEEIFMSTGISVPTLSRILKNVSGKINAAFPDALL